MQASPVRINWRIVGIVVGVVAGFWLINRLSDSWVGTSDHQHHNSHHHHHHHADARVESHSELDVAKQSVEHTENKLKAFERRIEQLSRLLRESRNREKSADKGKINMGFKGKKLVHLDLKGAPPKMEFLLKLLPYFHEWGATGLLVEYEDMFPYSGKLEILKASDAYTNVELRTFLATAKENHLDVVPLVQTFGHLEFVLKHKKFAKLRETPLFTNSLCPNNEGSVPLVQSMIKQVIEAHPDISLFHVGGDEVWNLKTCKVCEADRRNKSELFIKHMTPVLNYIKNFKKTEPKVTPLMWEDMMREWTVDQLKAVSHLMEPMVWAYNPNPDDRLSADMWDRYAAAFPRMWAASAFKGATEAFSNYVPVGFHVSNNLAWTRIIRDLPSSTTMVGIALTGWSRFDHYATLCELLPAGLPSLAFCLAALDKGEMTQQLEKEVSEALNFKEPLYINQRSFLIHKYKPLEGGFPGARIYQLVGLLKAAVYEMNGVRRLDRGWFLDREIKTKFLSYFHLQMAFNKSKNSLERIEEVKKRASAVLSEAYTKSVVDEWIKDKLDDKVTEAEGYVAKYNALINQYTANVD